MITLANSCFVHPTPGCRHFDPLDPANLLTHDNFTAIDRPSLSEDKKRGTWYVVVDLPHDPATGKRRQLRRRGFATNKASMPNHTRRRAPPSDEERRITAVIGEFDRHRYCDPALVEARGCGRSMPVNRSSLVPESAFGIGASKRPWCRTPVEQVADLEYVAPLWWVLRLRRLPARDR